MNKKRIALSIALIMTLIGVVSFAKPKSAMTFSVGPYLSNGGFELMSNIDLTLDFWVAHVESSFQLSAVASNNTIVLTPESSNVFKYVSFDWGNFKVEYGATNVHSSFFPTAWDVGTIPEGWTWMIGGGSNGNRLEVASDRGTYFVRYKGFFYGDAFWYSDASDFTLSTVGENRLFVDGGTNGDSYFLGLGGKYGAFTVSLLGYSSKIDVFPNVADQSPSRYVTLIDYKAGILNALLAMTENEFYINGYANLPLFGGSLNFNLSSGYINEFIPRTSVSMSAQYTKSIGASTLFLNASYDKNLELWAGLEWSF